MKQNVEINHKLVLNDSFSINEFIFQYEGNGVIYSPYTSEVLLCTQSVIDFVNHLNKKRNQQRTSINFVFENANYHREIVEKLISMDIIVTIEP